MTARAKTPDQWRAADREWRRVRQLARETGKIAEQSENEVLQRQWATLLNDIDAKQASALGTQNTLQK